MYKILNIGGEDYKLEFSVEASLYDECTEKLFDFIGKAFGVTIDEETAANMTPEQLAATRHMFMKNAISGISNIPQTTLTLFYAGLLEHHGTCRGADGKIKCKDDAKDLIRAYFAEHADDGIGNYYDLMTICMDQMGEDGFFKLTGLEKMMSQSETLPVQKQKRTPQDHKKATKK